MTSKERLLAVLNDRRPDRIPWAPLIDGYYISSLAEQGIQEMNVVETLRYIGADVFERHVPVVKGKMDASVKYSVRREGDKEIQTFETPVGSVYQVYQQGGNTSFRIKHFIENKGDIKTYKYVVQSRCYEPDYQPFIKEQNYIGDDGLATASGPLTPIQVLLQDIMGIEGFTYAVADYPDEMHDLMEAMHKSNLDCYEVMAKSPAEIIIVYEDTSTTVMSPRWFDMYCADYLNQYADVVHKVGKIYISHMCGKLKGMRYQVANLTVDGVDSICPPTTGDTWAHEALEMWPGKVVIGGIEPPALKRMSVDQTKEYVLDILKKVAPGDRFILSTGDATSYGTPIENLMAITELIKQYGNYPVKF
jgi:hypothetical protein